MKEMAKCFEVYDEIIGQLQLSLDSLNISIIAIFLYKSPLIRDMQCSNFSIYIQTFPLNRVCPKN